MERNRPEEFQKRLRYFIEMTEKNKQFDLAALRSISDNNGASRG
jgi:hypothetical protein